MCVWGDEVILRVPMPAELSHTGEFRWAEKAVDRCIAPIVQALNDAGIHTANCCCGHGKEDGVIILHDGRELRIVTPLTIYKITKRCTVRSSPDGAQLIRLDPVKEDGTARTITGWESQPGWVEWVDGGEVAGYIRAAHCEQAVDDVS